MPNNKVSDAIAQYELRTNGLMSGLGERVEVTNIRETGEAYVADIQRTYVRDAKNRWRMKPGDSAEMQFSRCSAVQYLKSYIDLLVASPGFNE
jgi:hypothetical protein